MKYKTVDLDDREAKYGIVQDDLYQMIAYATKRGVPNVLLIYPGCGHQSTFLRRLVVNNALGDNAIQITACRIPMDSTNPNDIRDALEAATLLSGRGLGHPERIQLPSRMA
jgi:5-methylcytosine-specific restriction endonuclease McrBC regulatory subunit McrC